MRELMPAVILGAALGASAAGEPPPYQIPNALANHMLSGQNVRLVVLGDSITNSTYGALWPDGSSRSHCPPQNGMFNVWMPAHGWRGLMVPAIGGTDPTAAYSNWHGVGAFVRYYDEGRGLEPRVQSSEFPDGNVGWVVDSASAWRLTSQTNFGQYRATSYLYTPMVSGNELNHWSRASAQIGRGDLRVRHIVYTSPGMRSVPKLSFARRGDSEVVLDYPAPGASPRWDWVEYEAASPDSTWNRETERYETSSRLNYTFNWTSGLWHYITGGSLFYDAGSDGMQIATVAHGGWNSVDHLRTPQTFGQPGFYSYLERGFGDDALLSWLDALDMTGADRVPVVMVTVGTNIAAPDNGGMPEATNGVTNVAYANHVRDILARWRAIYAQRGLEPYFILLAMYDWGAGWPNPFIDSRAEWLWEVRQTDAHPERIGFVSLPATMGYLGAGFNPAWYFSSVDFHLSKAGAVKVAQILWDAFREARCPGDYNFDGRVSSDDMFDFLADFVGERLPADLTTSAFPGAPGFGVPDGLFTTDDFFYFLVKYVEACPE